MTRDHFPSSAFLVGVNRAVAVLLASTFLLLRQRDLRLGAPLSAAHSLNAATSRLKKLQTVQKALESIDFYWSRNILNNYLVSFLPPCIARCGQPKGRLAAAGSCSALAPSPMSGAAGPSTRLSATSPSRCRCDFEGMGLTRGEA